MLPIIEEVRGTCSAEEEVKAWFEPEKQKK